MAVGDMVLKDKIIKVIDPVEMIRYIDDNYKMSDILIADDLKRIVNESTVEVNVFKFEKEGGNVLRD